MVTFCRRNFIVGKAFDEGIIIITNFVMFVKTSTVKDQGIRQLYFCIDIFSSLSVTELHCDSMKF